MPTFPQTVLISGAAAGIGRAAALRFAEAGFLVGAFDVDATGLETLGEELGDAVVTGLLDVRDAEQWQAALEALTERSDGRLDVLVNNAGILRSGAFSEIPLAAQRQIVDVNVTGVLNGCYTAYPFLRATPGARVINLASASAIYGQAELATYSASKFAVRGLTEALDLEWSGEGISVTALWPLFVNTAMTHGMDIGSTRSLGIHLTADEVAEAIFAQATQRRSALPPAVSGVHTAVGGQAKALFLASSVAPSWILRQVNRRVGKH